MSLLPASGFQSGQYRMIEIYATDFISLVARDKREELRNSTIEKQFEYLYWKFGATELSSGKKTLTLKQFEKKYCQYFYRIRKSSRNISLNFGALYNQFKSNRGPINARISKTIKAVGCKRKCKLAACTL